jgi:NitT/TauT family transport system substrate-binding protein
MSRAASFSRLLVVVALAGATWCGGAAAQSLTKLKFSLDWRFEGHTSFYHMARAKGYFEQEGLDVQVDAGAGSVAAVQRVATGAYDLSLGDISALIEFMGNNPGPARLQAIYMKYDQLPLAYAALKKSGIQSFNDLPGKSIAAANFEVTKRLFPIFARAAKIDPASVNWVSIDSALRINAVLKGEAQVFGSFIPVVELGARGVKQEDEVILRTADLGVRLYGNAIISSTRLIQENPKVVAGFVRAVNRAFIEGLADPAASVRHLKQREPLVDEQLELQRFIETIPSMVTVRTRANGLGAVDMATLAKQVDDVTEVFATKTKPDPAVVFNPSFLPPKAERMPPAGK